DIELARRDLYRDLPDRRGAGIDGGCAVDDPAGVAIDLPCLLPKTNDDVRIEQQPHFPSSGEIGPFNIKSRISGGSGASIAAATSSLITPFRVPNLIFFFGFLSSSGTSFAIGMPDLAMITPLPLAA